MKIVITGCDGFIGLNLSEYFFHNLPNANIVLVNRYILNSNLLFDKIENADIIIHCAGINRGRDLYKANIDLNNILIKAIESVSFHGKLINLSSIHAENNSEYGLLKKEIEDIYYQHSKLNNYNSISIRLPNVFGPYSKENYNTVVATFITNLLHKKESNINEAEIPLIYVKNVCEEIVKILRDSSLSKFTYKLKEDVKVNIKVLFKTIERLVLDIDQNKIIFKSDFEKNLFRTITYFRHRDNLLLLPLVKHSDERGWFSELLRFNGEGQISVSRTVSEIRRGNHYHTKKLERFIILSGQAEVQLISFNGNKTSYKLEPNTSIDIPNYHIHSLKKLSEDDLFCAFWVDEFYDINNSDTFYL